MKPITCANLACEAQASIYLYKRQHKFPTCSHHYMAFLLQPGISEEMPKPIEELQALPTMQDATLERKIA